MWEREEMEKSKKRGEKERGQRDWDTGVDADFFFRQSW